MKATLSNGRSVAYPIRFDGVDQTILTFDVRASDVARLLPRDLRPLDCGYGLSEMFVHWQTTRTSDLGSFDEMLIGFLVEEPYYRSAGAYFLVNPVTSAEARTLGMELWGIHKVLARIDCQRDAARMRSTLTLDDQFVLAMNVPVIGGPPCDFNTFACAGEGPRSTVFRYRQRAPRCAVIERPVDVSIEFGRHPLSTTISGLLLGSSVKRYIMRQDCRILIGPTLNSLLVAPGN